MGLLFRSMNILNSSVKVLILLTCWHNMLRNSNSHLLNSSVVPGLSVLSVAVNHGGMEG